MMACLNCITTKLSVRRLPNLTQKNPSKYPMKQTFSSDKHKSQKSRKLIFSVQICAWSRDTDACQVTVYKLL